mmetsp:Transcript_85340/g.178329  ORF Transcript_85340/g.178329 Transcript_85340/m.178329 type:complete len:1257 (-) Transcript_85340:115-3885(-)
MSGSIPVSLLLLFCTILLTIPGVAVAFRLPGDNTAPSILASNELDDFGAQQGHHDNSLLNWWFDTIGSRIPPSMLELLSDDEVDNPTQQQQGQQQGLQPAPSPSQNPAPNPSHNNPDPQHQPQNQSPAQNGDKKRDLVPRRTKKQRTERYIKFWAAAVGIYLLVALTFWSIWVYVVPFLERVSDRSITAGLRFKDDRLEELWHVESEQRTLQRGAKMMLLMALCDILFLTARELETPKCIPESRDSLVSTVGFIVLQVVGILCVLAACVYVMIAEEINRVKYWTLVVVFSFLIPAMSCPPFQYTVDRMQWACAVEIENGKDPYVDRQLEFSDFSVMGLSSTMMMMCWIWALPWILPHYQMILFLWTWLVGVYIGWGLTYFAIFPPPTHPSVVDLRRWIDISVRFGIVIFTWILSTGKKWYLEQAERTVFASNLREFHATKKMYKVLAVMVPEYVILDMLENKVIAHPIPVVSILFSEIQDFDRFAQTKSPKELLDFLNAIFDKFDRICIQKGVTKIETWGHEYVACVGNLPADQKEGEEKGHGVLLERLLRAGAAMLELQGHFDVEFRMGVHSGKIVAGVIGNKLPRYRLFGDTINTAARQMQRSEPGKLQFGEETKLLLPEKTTVGYTYRGEVEMKGKGAVKAYTVNCENPRKSEQSVRSLQSCQLGGIASKLCRATQRIKGEREQQQQQQGLSAIPLHLSEAVRLKMSLSRAMEMQLEEEQDEGGDTQINRTTTVDPYEDLCKEMDEANEEDEVQSDRLKNIISAFMGKSTTMQSSGRLLSQKAGFTPEMEAAWFEEYHLQTFCKGLVPNLARFAVAILFLTMLEAAYIRYTSSTLRFEAYSGGDLVLFYLCGRSVAVSVLLFWWYVASTTFWIHRSGFLAEILIVISTGFAAFAVGLSYESMSAMHGDALEPSFSANHPETRKDLLSADQCFCLSFVLQFHMLSRSQAFLFIPSLLFLAVAIGFVSYDVWGAYHAMLPFRGTWLFLFNAVLNTVLAHEGEQESRARFKANLARNSTSERTQCILETLMPPLVVQQIRELGNGDLPTHIYRHATLAQSDLCGFTSLAATKSPDEVVALVQDLFGRFDRASDARGIYKVETVGDAYIAGMAEEPLTVRNSPMDVVLFGLDMVRQVEEWSDSIGASVRCRVGIHHGTCIGGIVGNDMQRYHIFGEMMNYIEILESTGVESKVQVSKHCKAEIEHQMSTEAKPKMRVLPAILGFEKREGDQLKTSKGEVHEYSEVGGETYWVLFEEA